MGLIPTARALLTAALDGTWSSNISLQTPKCNRDTKEKIRLAEFGVHFALTEFLQLPNNSLGMSVWVLGWSNIYFQATPLATYTCCHTHATQKQVRQNCLQTGWNSPCKPFLSQTQRANHENAVNSLMFILLNKFSSDRIVRSPSDSTEQWGEKTLWSGWSF